MTKQSAPTFARTPHPLVLDKRVGNSAFRLWCMLAVLDWHDENITYDKLMDLMDAGYSSLLRWLRQLEDAGWLKWQRHADRQDRFKLNAGPLVTPEAMILARIREVLDSRTATLSTILAIVQSYDSDEDLSNLRDLHPNLRDDLSKMDDRAPNLRDDLSNLRDRLSNLRDQATGDPLPELLNARPQIHEIHEIHETHEIHVDPPTPTEGEPAVDDGDVVTSLYAWLVDQGMQPRSAKRFQHYDPAAAQEDFNRRMAGCPAEKRFERIGAVVRAWEARPPSRQAGLWDQYTEDPRYAGLFRRGDDVSDLELPDETQDQGDES